MESFAEYLLAAVAGLLLGGLTNVLADDLPRRQLPRRPHCTQCGHPRPVAAWWGLAAHILRRHTCLNCGTPLSLRHPLLEAALALAFAYVFSRYGWTLTGLFIALYVWLAALITVIDLEHRLVLNVVMGPAILLALLEAALTPRLSFGKALLGGAIGFGVVLGIFALGEAFRRLLARLRGEAIEEVAFGFGDVTLATFAGLVVGHPGIWVTLILMILVGGAGAFLYLAYRRFIRRNYSVFTAIPYGPNIIVGMLAVLIWPEELKAFLLAGYGS